MRTSDVGLTLRPVAYTACFIVCDGCEAFIYEPADLLLNHRVGRRFPLTILLLPIRVGPPPNCTNVTER